MAKRAKDLLGVDELEVVSRHGLLPWQGGQGLFGSRHHTLHSQARTSASRKRGLFSKEDFRYDPEQDCYWCPAGSS